MCGGIGETERLRFGKPCYIVVVTSNCTIWRSEQKLGIQGKIGGIVSAEAPHTGKEREAGDLPTVSVLESQGRQCLLWVALILSFKIFDYFAVCPHGVGERRAELHSAC